MAAQIVGQSRPPFIGDPDADFVEWPPVEMSYINRFHWEYVDITWWRRWVGANYSPFVVIGVIYLVLIFTGQLYMRNRPPFDLKRWLIAWNAGLAIFSIMTSVRTIPELYHQILNNGWHGMVCYRNDHSPSTAFWGWAFLISKIVELGDTSFIILRKKPLIFLHWYHHLTVLLSSFYFFPRYEPFIALGSLINAIVHSFMYTYYVFMSSGFKVPRKIAMSVTIIQLIQFVYIILVTLYVFAYRLAGGECAASYKSIRTMLFIISTYFVLFGIFFRDAYLKKKKIKGKEE